MARRWLVTIASGRFAEAAEHLIRLGCRVEPELAVPLDDDTVVPVSGPDDLDRRLAAWPGVKAVHPDSDLTLY